LIAPSKGISPIPGEELFRLHLVGEGDQSLSVDEIVRKEELKRI